MQVKDVGKDFYEGGSPFLLNVQGKPLSNRCVFEVINRSKPMLFMNGISMAHVLDNEESPFKMFNLPIREQIYYDEWVPRFLALSRGEEVEGYELLLSRRCSNCDKILTRPTSVKDGMGSCCKNRLEKEGLKRQSL